MTHPSDASRPTGDPGAASRLVLDEGESLELGSASGEVVLRLPASRAYDLGQVLEAYTRIGALVSAASTVSSTERSLARGLRDASAVGYTPPAVSPRSNADATTRLRAMAELQLARRDLSHSVVAGVVDAVAWMLGQEQEYDAIGVLDAVTGDGEGTAAYLALVGYDELRSDELRGDGGETS